MSALPADEPFRGGGACQSTELEKESGETVVVGQGPLDRLAWKWPWFVRTISGGDLLALNQSASNTIVGPFVERKFRCTMG